MRKCCFVQTLNWHYRILILCFCVIQDFCGAILHAKFEYRLPYDLFFQDLFFKIEFFNGVSYQKICIQFPCFYAKWRQHFA